MTGDKPDERLRTPMQWTAGASGFTRGTPWEALQGDTMTTSVAAQEANPGSLLNEYRRLIHQRDANAALAVGELVPLDASQAGALSYLRRTAGRSVLVLANLGTAALDSVRVSSAARALPPGTYRATDLRAGARLAAYLRVGADGRIVAYTPLATLAPMRAQVLELARIGR